MIVEDPIQHAHEQQQRIYDALRAHLGTSMSPDQLVESIDVLSLIAEWPIEDSSELGEGWDRARAEAIREAIDIANAYLRVLYLTSTDPMFHRKAS